MEVMKFMLRHRTLLRLIALKMASMLVLFVLASCGSNFDELEQGEDELAQEQAQVWEQAQQLRAAERRATATQAQVREQAQQLLDDDIPQGWRISEDEASNLLRDGNEGEGCSLCYDCASLFNHGSCRCSNTACGKIICQQCYRNCRQSDTRRVRTRCPFCRAAFLDE